MTSTLFEVETDPRRHAHFSPCRRYRYALWRTWGLGPAAMFVGLNPSTANETEDDPTIRRCVRFARDWGFDGLVMANLFGLVSSDPTALLEADDPVGPSNDMVLAELALAAGVVVAAWGAFPQAAERARLVAASGVLGRYAVLGLTADGQPRHPLYMKASCVPLDPEALAPFALPHRDPGLTLPDACAEGPCGGLSTSAPAGQGCPVTAAPGQPPTSGGDRC